MRLAFRIFAASALVILVLVGVAIWSLLAVNGLVEVNRETMTQSLPALRFQTTLREAVRALVRLEGRALVLRDESYAALWDERATRTSTDLEILHAFLTTQEELDRYREAVAAFTTYRRLVAAERAMVARGNREGALRLSERQARAAAEEAETALDRLTTATNSALDRSQTAAAELEQRTWKAILIALVASLVLALATTGFLAFRMTRSLRRLSVATAQLAEGSFTKPLPVESTDEIGDLARSFNRMAERLREVDLLKQEFFSHISHDLRTPLTSVREATQLLLERIPGPLEPKQERLVDIIRASTDRVLGMVSQILEFSRLRARLLPLDRRWVSLDKVVARGLNELRSQAEERGIAVDRKTSGSDFGVFGDEDRLVRVLVNLLDNAIKFTPSGGSVRVCLADLGDAVELVIEDSGVGIPADALPGIFDPYRQVHRGEGGSGLGLAIVKGLLEAHGGQVRVESEEGKGSRFIVSLPRKAPTGGSASRDGGRAGGEEAGEARPKSSRASRDGGRAGGKEAGEARPESSRASRDGGRAGGEEAGGARADGTSSRAAVSSPKASFTQRRGLKWSPGLALLVAVMLVAGCALIRQSASVVDGQSEAARLVTRAERLAQEGQPVRARDLYEQVLREHRGDPARARALYGLARIQVDPGTSLRDYRAAHASFDRLAVEYPRSPLAPEARAWRATLADLLARENEATKLKADLRRLRRLDMELERRR